MKIVIISNNYPPVIDGVGDHTFFLSAALKKRGHSVSVICSASKEIITGGDIEVYPIIQEWDKEGYRTALNKIREISPDYILLQYVPYGFQRIGIPWRMVFFLKELHKTGIPCLIHFHEMFVRLSWELRKIFPVGIIQRIIAFFMCRYADRVVTSTTFYKDYLSPFTNKTIEVISIPPNYDTSLHYSEEEINALKNTISVNGEKIVATFGVRDPDMILKVFQKVMAGYQNVKFMICGKVDNTFYKVLKMHTYFTGFLGNNEILKYLKAADVFFLPDYADKNGKGGTSRKSGSLAAALFADLPVVGIRGDYNKGEALANQLIYLENYYDIEKIAKKIIELLMQEKVTSSSEDRGEDWNSTAGKYFN